MKLGATLVWFVLVLVCLALLEALLLLSLRPAALWCWSEQEEQTTGHAHGARAVTADASPLHIIRKTNSRGALGRGGRGGSLHRYQTLCPN